MNKEETFGKLEKVSSKIAKLIKESKWNYNYRISENLLKELKIRQYI